MEQNIRYMLDQLDKLKTERDRQLCLFNWIRGGTITFKEYQELIKYLVIPNVSTRTFRFSGIKDGEKFVKEIQAPDRESAIADFELTYPDLTWRFSADIT